MHDDAIYVRALWNAIILVYAYTSTGQAKERPHLLVLAFPLYALAA